MGLPYSSSETAPDQISACMPTSAHSFFRMNFNVKLDDKKLQVNVESTNLKDILIYCKPKERLVLIKKF